MPPEPHVILPDDPIVAEVHRIRQELLDEFDGDIDALADDTDRRLLSGHFGDVKIVLYPPKRPANWPGAQSRSTE